MAAGAGNKLGSKLEVDQAWPPTFVSPPPSELECPICLLLMREPHLTSCCGNHFCSACISEVRKRGDPCPLCKAEVMHTLLNRKEKCRITELKVYCSAREAGCMWVGELGDLKSHVAPGKESGPCQFVLVECRLSCRQDVRRADLTRHIESECPCRLQSCPYCGEEATGKDLASHFESCQHFPVVCPHMCELTSLPRSQLSAHLEVCPNQPLPCPFFKVGCKVDLKRSQLKDHLQSQLLDHLTMVVEKLEMVETRNRNLEGLVAESEKREELKNAREAEMQARISLLESRLERCERGTRMRQEGLVDVEPEVLSCEPLPAMQGRRPSWTSELSNTQDEDVQPEESTHVDTGAMAESNPDCHRSSLLGKWFRKMYSSHTSPSSDTLIDAEPVGGKSGEPKPQPSAASAPLTPNPPGVMPLVLQMEGAGPTLQLRLGSITNLSADAVVVPTGHRLRRNRGCFREMNMVTQGLLSRLTSEYARCNGRLKTGEATCFNIQECQLAKYKTVVCVVTPKRIEHSMERGLELLRTCCHSVVKAVLELGAASLVVPALGVGLDGFESKLVAHTLVQAFTDYAYPENCVLKEVCFVTLYNSTHTAFESYFKDRIVEMMGARRQTAAQLITQL